jgi:pimeloyl-ACP methyl ester carboxylesterase
MPQTVVNGISIAWERHGLESDPLICLIHGLGMPLTAWPKALIEGLVANNFCVVTMDNRDIGQSQLMDGAKVPGLFFNGLKRTLGLPVNAPYRLDDMMSDTAELVRFLGAPRAHVVGVSMGGMIAQLFAIHHPDRVASLTSIMSTTGNRNLPHPDPEIARHMFSRPKTRSKEDRVAFNMKTWRLISSPAYPSPAAEREQFILRNLDRGATAAGIRRQTLAIMAAPSRIPQLNRLNMPCTVIHGQEDRLVRVDCGEDTARAIPGAKLHLIPGMGHDLPSQLIDTFVRIISEQAKRIPE